MDKSQFEVRGLKWREIPNAGEIINASFFSDPWWKYLFPDEEERQAIGPWLASSWIRYAYLWGSVWTTPQLEGVALRRGPGQYPMPLWKIFLAGMISTPQRLGPSAFMRLEATL